MNCDDFERLKHDWIDGCIAADEARLLKEHTRACPTCADSLNQLEALRRLLRASATENASESAKLRALGAVLRAAADESAMALPLADPRAIMTLAEVAALLRVSEAKVRALLHEIPHFIVAGELRFRRESIERWIDREEQRTAAARIPGPVLALVPDKGAPWALTG
jgi:anti-sigma factor RsiW